jgi:hypothetical protein
VAMVTAFCTMWRSSNKWTSGRAARSFGVFPNFGKK